LYQTFDEIFYVKKGNNSIINGVQSNWPNNMRLSMLSMPNFEEFPFKMMS